MPLCPLLILPALPSTCVLPDALERRPNNPGADSVNRSLQHSTLLHSPLCEADGELFNRLPSVSSDEATR